MAPERGVGAVVVVEVEVARQELGVAERERWAEILGGVLWGAGHETEC